MGDVWIAIALVLLAVNFFLPSITLVVACVLAGFLVWKADLRYFPAILLLHFSARNFILEGFGTEEHLLETLDYAYMQVGGFPVTVGNIVSLVITFRWLYALIFDRDPVINKHRGLVLLWCLAAPVSTIITIVANHEGLLNPTQAVRGLLGFGVFFYGMVVARSWPLSKEYFIDRLLLICGIVCLLGRFGICGTNFFFFFLAMGPVLAVVRLKAKLSTGSQIIAGFTLVTSILYAILGQPGGAGADSLASTLTSMAQGVLSLVLGVFIIGSKVGGLFFSSYRPALLICLLFTAYAIRVAGTIDADSNPDSHLEQRIQFKVYGDRAPLWKMTWQEICTPPYVIRRFKNLVTESGREQKFGAHNTFLQTLHVQGWWSGPLFILLCWGIMDISQKVLRRAKDRLLQAVYGGLFVVNTIGMTTGHLPAVGDYLFIWGTLAGVCVGSPLYEKTWWGGGRPQIKQEVS